MKLLKQYYDEIMKGRLEAKPDKKVCVLTNLLSLFAFGTRWKNNRFTDN